MVFGRGGVQRTTGGGDAASRPLFRRVPRRSEQSPGVSVQEVVGEYHPGDQARVRQILETGLDQKHRWLYLEFRYDRREKAITIDAQKPERGILAAFKRFLPGAKSRKARKAANSFRTAVREATADLEGESLQRYVDEGRRRRWVSLGYFRQVKNLVSEVGQTAIRSILTERVIPSIAPKVQDDSWGQMAEGVGLNPGDRSLQSFFVQRFPSYLFDQLAREDRNKLMDYEGKKYDDLSHSLKRKVADAAISLMEIYKDLHPPRPVRSSRAEAGATVSILDTEKAVDRLFTRLKRGEPEKFVDELDGLVKQLEQMMKKDGDPLYDGLSADDYKGRRDRAIDSILTPVLGRISTNRQVDIADDMLGDIKDIGKNLKELEARDLTEARLRDGGVANYLKSYASWGYQTFWNSLGYQMPRSVTETDRAKERANFRREFVRQLSRRLAAPEKLRVNLVAEVGKRIVAAT